MKVLLLTTVVALAASLVAALPKCGGDGELHSNPSDCDSYYECVGGTPILMKCPPGLVWADQYKRCDFPNVANCKETETPEPTTQSTTTTGNSGPTTPRPTECPDKDDPNHDVLLPNPEDCGSFFKCLEGVPHLIKCPPGQEWSTELSRCDYPEIAQCEETVSKPTENPGTPSTSGPTSERPTECPEVDDPNNDVLLPNPDDCGSFFKCSEGVPHLIKCPPGQEWSIELNRCDYPEIAKCTETRSKIIHSRTDDRCPAEDGPEDVLLPNPDDCQTFFKCNNGDAILQKCPDGLHWNDDGKYCDFPESAGCQKPKYFAVRAWPTECPAENGVYDTFLPNTEDCSTYYKCDNGRKILMDCPVGTLWHAPMQRCDHAGIAECATE